MGADFFNVYDDKARADAYAALEFPGTYYLAYRDLPAIIAEHVHGRKAVDFGCGAGRSTRFLRRLGFDAVGADIAEPMLALARERDPGGAYLLVPDGDLRALPANAYDLVFSVFTFDNVPTLDRKVALFRSLKQRLKKEGRTLTLEATPDIYVNHWPPFSTRDFPGNRTARSGDEVFTMMLDVEDRRPVADILCTDEDYQAVYRRAELVPLKTYRPLAKPSEPFSWVSETRIPPWVIYVLGAAE